MPVKEEANGFYGLNYFLKLFNIVIKGFYYGGDGKEIDKGVVEIVDANYYYYE